MVNDKENKENLIAKYPTQFMLFYMYDIDDKTGMTGTWNVEKQEMEKQKTPQELILGASCIQEKNRSFTVKELITMLKAEFSQNNVVELTDTLLNQEKN